MSDDNIKDWTIMVYMAGDNDLAENMAYSLNDIGNVGIGLAEEQRAQVNLLAFFDSSSLTAPTYYLDFSKPKHVKHPIKPEDNHHPEKPTYKPKAARGYDKDGNSASAYSIMNFVRWCIETQKCKAKNYALIFSGHSFGFHGTSFLRDNSSGGYLTLFKFRWALEEVIKKYLGNEKISILGFDSCVMSTLEVGYELKDVAQVLVASEGSLPTAGWGYAPMLNEFIVTHGENFDEDLSVKDQYYSQKSKPRSNAATKDYVKECARGFVTSFVEQQKKLVLGGRAIDITAWDLEKVEPIVKSVNRLGKKLNRRLDLTDKIHAGTLEDSDIGLYQELKKILHQAHYESQTYMSEQCVDLKDFCRRLRFECRFLEEKNQDSIYTEIISNCTDIIRAVDECVLQCGYCGDSYQFSNGISIYFPWSGLTYLLTDFRYRYLRFTRGARNYKVEMPKGIGKYWREFLYTYVMRVTMRPARKSAGNKLARFADFSEDKPVWSKENPIWSKENPIWSKEAHLWDRISAPSEGNGDAAPGHKDNPATGCKGNCRGEIGEYLIYFSRFKNYQMSWDISGFSDDK